MCLLSFPHGIPQLGEVGHTRAVELMGHIVYFLPRLFGQCARVLTKRVFGVAFWKRVRPKRLDCFAFFSQTSVGMSQECHNIFKHNTHRVYLHAQVHKASPKVCVCVSERELQAAPVQVSPVLCELWMSVDAWIRTCKAGLARS